MAGISSVGGGSAAEIAIQRQVRVAKMVKDATEMQGDMAMKLIQSAAVNTGTGSNLNISV